MRENQQKTAAWRVAASALIALTGLALSASPATAQNALKQGLAPAYPKNSATRNSGPPLSNPNPTSRTKMAHPAPHVPTPIFHAPGATNLDPGLNTNDSNDPLPAAFQYGTGSDPFDGQTGEGSGPESTRRTAALHNGFVEMAANRPGAARKPAAVAKKQLVPVNPLKTEQARQPAVRHKDSDN